MNHYALFEEFDGRRSLPVDMNHPKQVIIAETILSAIQSFSDKNHLRLVDYDDLPDHAIRAYCRKKSLFRRDEQYIYYIRRMPEDVEKI
ncbi:hypothetical protein EWH99_02580 [Sporolactobacillus sp. THM7-7]|nr:hypothetical protein EWH99_02580 [Sporolactobacillus sp. THM7-7]